MSEQVKIEEIPLPDRYVALAASQVEHLLSVQQGDGGMPMAGQAGRFSSHDQTAIHALAFLYGTEHACNPWAGDARVLDATVRLGDFLAAHTDDGGGFAANVPGREPQAHVDQWLSQAWLEALLLVEDDLGEQRAALWRGKLRAAGASLAEVVGEWSRLEAPYHTRSFDTSPNHASTRAAFVYRAGVVFGEPEWCELVDRFMPRYLEMQDADGCWPEYAGPVILYAMVSLCGVGQYYEYTGNEQARAAIERTIPYLARTCYPDGGPIALLDGRQQHTVNHGTWAQFALSLTPEGRALCDHLTRSIAQHTTVNGMALHRTVENYRHYHEGPLGRLPLADEEFTWRMSRTAGVRKDGPWMWGLSGIITPRFKTSPFSLDRQTLVSVYHASAGRILNGANCKERPAAATFASGSDPSDFLLVESSLDDAVMHLDAGYQRFRAAVAVRAASPTRLELSARLLRRGKDLVLFRLQSAAQYGDTVTLDGEPRQLADDPWEASGVRELSWKAVTLQFEVPTRVWWPFEGFNSYAPDHTYPDLRSARLILETPLAGDARSTTVVIEVGS